MTRGHAERGETCDIVGVGPVPVSVVRDMMDDAFLAALITRGQDVASVVHLNRKAKALQRTLLEWRDPECCVLGCTQTARLEIDHETGWAITRVTSVDDLDRLCHYHHDLKTRCGYRLAPGKGKRLFLPPGVDPPGDPPVAA